jgi:BirA family transcriptional regulator, biotin operon repressor / biotin---[acetyl-CoA-carboxylase] ligase
MHLIGQSFTILETVDSTNNYAMREVQEGKARHGNAYFTLSQTAGKGQRGKSWSANPGENIILSVVIEPSRLILSEQFMLSITIALACCDLFNEFDAGEFSIKWPNDLYWRDRKAGGILIENILQGTHWQFSVAGIGINVNQTAFSPHLPNPVSLKQITGRHFDILDLARKLCGHIQHRLNRLQEEPSETLLQEYNALLYRKQQTVKLKKENIVFETFIRGVNMQGKLMTKAAMEQEFNWGEVEWVI